MGSDLRRRTVLRGAGTTVVAGALAGCSSGSSAGIGSAWERKDPPAEKVGIFDMTFVDETTGWAAVSGDQFGNEGGFYRTDDGGDTWSRSRAEEGRVVAVPDEGERVYGFGDAGGSDFHSWYTDDGGEQWQPIRASTGGTPSEAAFLTDDVGFVVSLTGAELRRTVDGAESFELRDLEECTANDIATTGDDVWIVGQGEASEPNEGACLMHSPERGQPGTWTVHEFADEAHDFAGGPAESIYTPDGEEVWVAGSSRQLYHSTDGGTSWTQIEGLDEEISSFVAVDGVGDHLLLVGLGQGSSSGQDGLIYESTDGGETWERAWSPGEDKPIAFDDVEFFAPDRALAYGRSGAILRYTG